MNPTPVQIKYIEFPGSRRNPKSYPISAGIELIEASSMVRDSELYPFSVRVKNMKGTGIHGY